MYQIDYLAADGARVQRVKDELLTLCAAKREAIIIAKQLAADGIGPDEPHCGGVLEICEDTGRVILMVPVSMASADGTQP